MPRGQTSEIGEERKQQNGYWTIRTSTGWRFKHHVIAEQVILKRPLATNESVRFRDGDKDNLHPDNLLVHVKGDHNLKKRLAIVQERIRELRAEEADILTKLAAPEIPTQRVAS
jgi:hypothetical protein